MRTKCAVVGLVVVLLIFCGGCSWVSSFGKAKPEPEPQPLVERSLNRDVLAKDVEERFFCLLIWIDHGTTIGPRTIYFERGVSGWPRNIEVRVFGDGRLGFGYVNRAGNYVSIMTDAHTLANGENYVIIKRENDDVSIFVQGGAVETSQTTYNLFREEAYARMGPLLAREADPRTYKVKKIPGPTGDISTNYSTALMQQELGKVR